MKELSLHILDLVENAAAAGARHLYISVLEDERADRLNITVEDDGAGMPRDLAARACDPFTTTRATREVGLGLPLLAAAAQQAGGSLRVDSTPGLRTEVQAHFGLTHIDRAPLGRIADTLIAAAILHPHLRTTYEHRTDRGRFAMRLPQPSPRAPAAALSARVRDALHDGLRRIRAQA